MDVVGPAVDIKVKSAGKRQANISVVDEPLGRRRRRRGGGDSLATARPCLCSSFDTYIHIYVCM